MARVGHGEHGRARHGISDVPVHVSPRSSLGLAWMVVFLIKMRDIYLIASLTGWESSPACFYLDFKTS